MKDVKFQNFRRFDTLKKHSEKDQFYKYNSVRDDIKHMKEMGEDGAELYDSLDKI